MKCSMFLLLFSIFMVNVLLCANYTLYVILSFHNFRFKKGRYPTGTIKHQITLTFKKSAMWINYIL